jgi:nucleotide-binding universal stress UspA family protein
MKRHPILVATDGAEPADHALRLATQMAAATREKLVVVTVWRELRADFGIPLATLIPDLIEVEKKWAADVLAAASTRALAAGVEVERIRRYGNAAREICAVAKELEARLIVVGSSGWGAFDGGLFGNVSRRVVDEAPCPVLVVPAPRPAASAGEARQRERTAARA